MQRSSIPLGKIMENLKAAQSPLPAPANVTLRQWFIGLVMANPALMNGIAPENRIAEALKIADDLVAALATPRVPSIESMSAPSPEEMAQWEVAVESQNRQTIPASKLSRKKTLSGIALPSELPPPTQRVPLIPPPPFRREEADGRYSVIMPEHGTTVRPRR